MSDPLLLRHPQACTEGGQIYNFADPEMDLYRQGLPPSLLSLLQTAHSVGWADTSALLSLDPPGEDSIKKISDPPGSRSLRESRKDSVEEKMGNLHPDPPWTKKRGQPSF